MTMKQLNAKLAEMEALHKIAMESENEQESDTAYIAEWEIIDSIASEIERMSQNRIDRITSRRMVVHHAEQLREIFAAAN